MEYVCLECEECFEQPHILVERHTETQPGWRERVSQSPCCGAGYVPAGTCPGCGRPIPLARAGTLCRSCVEQAGQRLRQFLSEQYAPEELAALDELLEGISFTQLGQKGERKHE